MSENIPGPSSAGEQQTPGTPRPFSADPRPMTPARCGCMLFIALLTLAIFSVIAIRMYLLKTIEPERMARLKKYDTEIVQLPNEWQSPAPVPSQQVVEFQEKFYREMENVREKFADPIYGDSTSNSIYIKMHSGDALTSAEQQVVESLVSAMEPVINETSAALSLPGYTADMTLYSSGTRFLEVQQFTKFSTIVALETARNGNCTRAMDIAALPIRYIKHEPPGSLIFNMIRVAVAHISVTAFDGLAAQCTDRAALQHGLTILNELRPQANPGPIDPYLLTDEVSLLCRAQAFGYPVDLTSQTRASLTRQRGEIWGEPYNRWAVKHFPPADARHKAAQEALRVNKQASGLPPCRDNATFLEKVLASPAAREFFGFSGDALAADLAQPSFLEAYTRAQVMFANYELVRLHMAQRLANLNGMPATNTVAPDVSAYISPIPTDPFSSGTMMYATKKGKFYSIGPDKDDDHINPVYDATNGTLSNGDIAR